MTKPKFFLVEVDDQEMCVSKIELVSMLRRGARFDCIRPLKSFDFDNLYLFYPMEEVTNVSEEDSLC